MTQSSKRSSRRIKTIHRSKVACRWQLNRANSRKLNRNPKLPTRPKMLSPSSRLFQLMRSKRNSNPPKTVRKKSQMCCQNRHKKTRTRSKSCSQSKDKRSPQTSHKNRRRTPQRSSSGRRANSRKTKMSCKKFRRNSKKSISSNEKRRKKKERSKEFSRNNCSGGSCT